MPAYCSYTTFPALLLLLMLFNFNLPSLPELLFLLAFLHCLPFALTIHYVPYRTAYHCYLHSLLVLPALPASMYLAVLPLPALPVLPYYLPYQHYCSYKDYLPYQQYHSYQCYLHYLPYQQHYTFITCLTITLLSLYHYLPYKYYYSYQRYLHYQHYLIITCLIPALLLLPALFTCISALTFYPIGLQCSVCIPSFPASSNRCRILPLDRVCTFESLI